MRAGLRFHRRYVVLTCKIETSLKTSKAIKAREDSSFLDLSTTCAPAREFLEKLAPVCQIPMITSKKLELSQLTQRVGLMK